MLDFQISNKNNVLQHNAQYTLTGLWQSLVRTNRLPEGSNISALSTLIRDRIHDPEKEVRQNAIRVLADLISALPQETIDAYIQPLLPDLIINLSNQAPAVRKSCIDCLKTYIRCSNYPDKVFMQILNYDNGLASVLGVIVATPSLVDPEILAEESLFTAVLILWEKAQEQLTQECSLKALIRLRRKISSTKFVALFPKSDFQLFETLCNIYCFHDLKENDSSSSSSDRVILETEINLESGPSITLQIHEESCDEYDNESGNGLMRILDNSQDEFYDDSVRRTPRRVRFGGEVVKMRTPESDSTNDEDGKNKGKPMAKKPKKTKNVEELTKTNVTKTKDATKVIGKTKPTKKEQKSLIPIYIRSLPNSPYKKQPLEVQRKYNSTPNLIKSSKIPIRLVNKKRNKREAKLNHSPSEKTKTKPKKEEAKQPSKVIDEKMITLSSKKPRRYSRSDDILSPVPIHNEIEVLHNLTRSPSRSPPRKGSLGDEYKSFQVCPKELKNVINKQIEQDKNNELVKIEESKSSKIAKSEAKKELSSAEPKISLAAILNDLQGNDIFKRSIGFNNLLTSLKHEKWTASIKDQELRLLLDILFIYESQARLKNESREALTLLVQNMSQECSKSCLGPMAKGFAKMGAPYGVRLAILLMKRTDSIDDLLKELPFSSNRGREGSLQIIMAACRLFPSTEIKVGWAAAKTMETLSDRRRKIRHASLETLASLAQAGGNGIVLDVAFEKLKTYPKYSTMLNVIRTRLSRKQLPSVDASGTVRYSSPKDQQEIDWLSSSSGSNQSVQSGLNISSKETEKRSGEAINYWKRNSRHQDDLVSLKNGHAILAMGTEIHHEPNKGVRKGVLHPVYCILPSTEESDGSTSTPAIMYHSTDTVNYLSPTRRLRGGSQDRLECASKEIMVDIDKNNCIRKSFSSDQLYKKFSGRGDFKHNYLGGVTEHSASPISSGSENNSDKSNQCSSLRWQGSGIPIPKHLKFRPKGSSNKPNLRLRSNDGSPASLKVLPRQSSGSESSGYFTPPFTERSSHHSLNQTHSNTSSIKQNSTVTQFRSITPIASPFALQTKQESLEEEEIESDFKVLQSSSDFDNGTTIEPPVQLQHEASKSDDYISICSLNCQDEVDNISSTSSIFSVDLANERPFQENRLLSKSEANLNHTNILPPIHTTASSRKLTSAPSIKHLALSTTSFDETPITPLKTAPTVLPGSTQEELPQQETPLLPRRLSKRYTNLPVAKKSSKLTHREPPASKQASSKARENHLETILVQLESSEWETTMIGLKALSKVASQNPDALEPQIHIVCRTLAKNIKNLRSQVARAACQAANEMFSTCAHRGMEQEIEELVCPLLQRTADTNKFLRGDANIALDTMSEHIPVPKVINVLTTKGCAHQNAIVRATSLRILGNLTKKHGVDKIFVMGKDTRDKMLLAGANALTEGSLESRKLAKELLGDLKKHVHFQKALLEAVPPHVLRHISKTLNSIN